MSDAVSVPPDLLAALQEEVTARIAEARSRRSTAPDPAALLAAADVEPLKEAIRDCLDNFPWEGGPDLWHVTDQLAFAVLNANWRPAAALAGTAAPEPATSGPGPHDDLYEAAGKLAQHLDVGPEALAHAVVDLALRMQAAPDQRPEALHVSDQVAAMYLSGQPYGLGPGVESTHREAAIVDRLRERGYEIVRRSAGV